MYGTTSSGGTNGGGTLFEMNLDGSGFQTLFSFGGTNGTEPEGKLVSTVQTLYGTTSSGGASNYGTVFGINNDGSGFTNLYSFDGASDGGTPRAGLALPVVDTLTSVWSVETTINGADNAASFIYSIAMDNYYILYVNGNFISWTNHGGDAEWSPYSSLAPYLNPGENDIRLDIGGDDSTAEYFAMQIQGSPALPFVLYGTTYGGGTNGYGTVFKIAFSNEDTVLYKFNEPPDGNNPIGDLVFSEGALYGVTQNGGANYNGSGHGTIFSIGTNFQNYKLLYTFGLTNADDGVNPEAGLVLVGETLYGTKEFGGASGIGTVFRINTDGSGYTNLYSFSGSPDDGAYPAAGLILSNNVLYGTTKDGGSHGGGNYGGTIFKVNTDGSGYSNFYSFAGSGANDGAEPEAPLLLVGANLYGTTSSGGGDNQGGTIFYISTNGTSDSILLAFGGTNGYSPAAGLALSGSTFYGTTLSGGSNSFNAKGTIFSFTLGNTTDVVLHTFSDAANDGENPATSLALSGGVLYGTTENGGVTNLGVIFSIGTNGGGYTNLLSFGAPGSDFGQNPEAGLIILSNSLYGTTYGGGTDGDGIVFSIATNGTGFSDIYNFMGNPGGQPADGANPQGGLCSP